MHTSNVLLRDVDYEPLKEFVIEHTGLSYYADRNDALAARIAQRLLQSGTHDCSSYLKLLQEGTRGQEELDHLIQDLTIGETYFFRHEAAFRVIERTVLPETIKRNATSRQLRIWSAGCSIGAEAYSLAILLQREFAPELLGWDVSILGTDINREFLARASAATYEPWALRGVPAKIQEQCFNQLGNNWRLRRKYREGVSFQYHNLVKHSFPSLANNLFAFDVILCRNVLIYFDLATIHKVVSQLKQCLVPGGWLIVGHAEYNPQVFAEFEAHHEEGLVLYRCPGATAALDSGISRVVSPPQRFDFKNTAPPAPSPVVMPKLEMDKRPRNTPPPIACKPSACSHTAATQPATSIERIHRLADAGKIDEALEICEELVRQYTLKPACHFCRGLLLDQKGDHAHAEAALNKAIYLDRGYVMAHYYRGLVLQKRGLEGDAAKSFSNVLRLTQKMEPSRVLPDSEGLTIADLNELAEMHLRTIQQT